MGIFYPVHYLVAALPSSEAAVEAGSALGSAGTPEDQVLALSSVEALKYFEEHKESKGVTGSMMQSVSRLLGDDSAYADAHIMNAREGHGFLMVRCETEEEANRIHEALKPYGPITIQWYQSHGIQSLI